MVAYSLGPLLKVLALISALKIMLTSNNTAGFLCWFRGAVCFFVLGVWGLFLGFFRNLNMPGSVRL